MKTFTRFVVGTILPGALLMASGCASNPLSSSKSGQDLAVVGPTVVDTKVQPGVFELNNNLQPTTPTQVVADVKDFQNRVSQVKLRFIHVPLEVPMQNLAGTTWTASLSPDQLKQLAVSGQTMKYDANVIAVNDKGQVATSQQPVQIAIKAPDLTQPQQNAQNPQNPQNPQPPAT